MADTKAQTKAARKRKFHRRLSIVVGVPLAVLVVYTINRVPSGPVTAVYAVDGEHVVFVQTDDEESVLHLQNPRDDEALASTPAGVELRVVGSPRHGVALVLVEGEPIDGLAVTLDRVHQMWRWQPPAEAGAGGLHLPASAVHAEVLGGVFLAFDGQVPRIFALEWSTGEVAWEASLVSGQTIEGLQFAGNRLVVWTSTADQHAGRAQVLDPESGAMVVLDQVAHSRCVADAALFYMEPSGALARASLSAPSLAQTLGDPLASVRASDDEVLRIAACGTRGDELIAALETREAGRSDLVGLDRETFELAWHLPLGTGSVAGAAQQRDFARRRPDLHPLRGELGRFVLLPLAGAEGELLLVDLDGPTVTQRLAPATPDLVVGRSAAGSFVLGPRSVAVVGGDAGDALVARGFPEALPIGPDQLVANAEGSDGPPGATGLWLTDGDDVGFCRLAAAEPACDGGDIEVVDWPAGLRALLQPLRQGNGEARR